MEDNSLSVFKSYLRQLVWRLKQLQTAIKEKDYDRAEFLIDKLVEDTQSGIED